MNNSYICLGDKVLISDTKGELKTDSNCENINEILAQENIIEHIEKEINNNNELLDQLVKPKDNLLDAGLLIIGLLFSMFLCYLVAKPNGTFIEGSTLDLLAKALTLGPQAVACLFPVPFWLIAGGALYGKKTKELDTYNKARRKLIGSNMFLNKRLEIEKAKLEELKANKTIVTTDIENNQIQKVDDRLKYSKLRLDLANVAIVLRDMKKYYRSYLNGNLIDKFKEKNQCVNEDMSYLEDLYEEAGPQLIKNFKIKK